MKTLSKAKTLEFLREKLTTAKILPLMIINSENYFSNKNSIVKDIQEYFCEDKLIIRSSSQSEDSSEASNAGKFLSVQNVNKNNSESIEDSITKVIESYGNEYKNQEVLIQPMLKEIMISGVVTTADISNLSPYYIINYEEGGSSSGITDGVSEKQRTYISYKYRSSEHEEEFLTNIINACGEIENILQNKLLDIEFGINTKNELYIFQVRPIVKNNKVDLSNIDLKDSLRKIYKKIDKLSGAHPNLLGKKALFGVMPDWNPAEIIGLRPKRLAISLYKELITDSTWAYQRDNYGYRNLRSHPLLISFLGVPYIDVRVSFNSFIPKSLDEGIANKLVEYYLEKLSKIPTYHDKVEFKIVHSCYYLNLSGKLTELLQHGFNKNEIKRIEYSLLSLTNGIINPETGIYKKDLKKIETLELKYQSIINSKLSNVDKIYWLLEECKRYGTLPFAGIARAAFIAMQFLRSFVETEIITRKEYDKFLNSINSVNKQMKTDLYKLSVNKISKEEFLNKYGHLRPGTYDILSPRYDEAFEKYFNLKDIPKPKEESFLFSNEKMREIDKILIENGLEITTENLIDFIKKVIEGREYLKFVFTKVLSKVFQLVEEFGKRVNLSTNDLAYLNIQRIKELYSTLDERDVSEIFNTDIEKNKIFYLYTQAVKLPSLITKPADIYSFHIDKEEPNFITYKSIDAAVINEDSLEMNDLKGYVVCIKAADPGYDFLFTKNIAALITQFGGTNSHMAIRCAELGIPAVIGCGERNFQLWSKANSLNIDCANRLVKVLS